LARRRDAPPDRPRGHGKRHVGDKDGAHTVGDFFCIPERGSHRAHTVVTTYVRPRSSAGRSGKPKSLPSVLGYLAPPYAPLIPTLLTPAPSASAPAGAHSSPSGHPRAPARSPHVLPRAPAPGPTHAVPACSPPPRRRTQAGSSRARVPVRHVVPIWRQPPGGFPPSGSNPSLVVSCQPANESPGCHLLDHPCAINWLAPVSRDCRGRGEPTGACPKGARRDARPRPKGQGVTPDRAPRPPPRRIAARLSPRLHAARTFGRNRRAPARRSPSRVPTRPPPPACHCIAHAVSRGAPPHSSRSGSRGGHRGPRVRCGRPRAGRPVPALRAAAVRP